MRDENLQVPRRLMKQKAKALGKDDFKASTGWLTLVQESFIKEKNKFVNLFLLMSYQSL